MSTVTRAAVRPVTGVRLSHTDALHTVAADAKERRAAALAALDSTKGAN